MTDEYAEIKEKLMKWFDKKMLSNETIYFILKDLQEQVWDNIKNEGDEDDMDDELDDFDDVANDEEPEEDEDSDEDEEPEEVVDLTEDEEDIDQDKPKRLNKLEAVRTFIKKPKVTIKGGIDGPD